MVVHVIEDAFPQLAEGRAAKRAERWPISATEAVRFLEEHGVRVVGAVEFWSELHWLAKPPKHVDLWRLLRATGHLQAEWEESIGGDRDARGSWNERYRFPDGSVVFCCREYVGRRGRRSTHEWFSVSDGKEKV